MVRKDGAEIRKQRIQEIATTVLRLLNIENEMVLSKLLATLEYQTGLTKDKLMEYLEIMESMGQFTLSKESDRIFKNSMVEHEMVDHVLNAAKKP